MARTKGKSDPPAPGSPGFEDVIRGYLECIEAIRHQRAEALRMQELHPDNCAWGNLVLKSTDQEVRAFRELREALGVGKEVFLGSDGRLHFASGIPTGNGDTWLDWA